ncbi:MAG: phospho-N-acetylmuramoyl-pentapeptide-transferase [Candidatus Saccharibacteria bacterium]|nr:phospho-N-acetylmuramoyl-pentapeptide-transferase [Candidatus Saccharibacteria bacterium]
MNNSLQSLTNEMTHILILSVVAFLFAMLLTPVYTFFAYRYRFWKRQRSASTDGKELKVFTKLHAAKFRRNVPTMAGVIGVVSVTVVTLLWNLDRAQTWLPLAALIGGGAVGLIDDVINIRGDGSGVAGLRSPVKFALVTLLGLVLGWFFFVKLGVDAFYVPFVGDVHISWLIVPLFAFTVVATGNAVNISDGLDGLAGGLLAISFVTFGVIALLQGNVLMAGFCFTVVGVLLSYLWFNIYPARFFMGDVGSFAYGAALGVVAMLTNTLLLLPVIGLLFVVEAGSSAVQIFSKKFFGRKVFISAPIHHHLEAKGWPEVKVTMRFWVIACVMACIGFVLALSGGYIA